eukprot:Tbor_TRINITY_DN4432_c0_g1::TRINITY_DN4432_c0_g1_i1::g.7934::m.7934/K10839/RAD23, HR23; UV excision repair protein RAD23
MKITLKTTAGRSIVKEFEPTNTMADIKDTFKDDYDVVSIRLCYKGKVLDDTKTIGEIGLSDTDAIFLSGKKLSIQKPAAPAVKEPVKSTTEAPASSPSSLPAPISPSPPTETVTISEDLNQQSPTVRETVLTATQLPAVSETVEVSHSLIDTIKAMGFDDEEQIKLALRAAYMNPDRAIDYLISGMSIGKLRELAEEASPSVPVHTGHPVARGAPTSSVVGMEEVQRALESIPQFDRIREHVVSNPNHLPIAMQQIQQYHPEAFAVIEQNPQAFLALIGGGGGGGESMADTGDGRVMQLTPEDIAPIERLVSIGGGVWDRHAATLVYLACNKNEEIAANVLFDNGGMPPQLAQAVIDGQSNGGDGEADEEDEN